jgi:hypothetical protein
MSMASVGAYSGRPPTQRRPMSPLSIGLTSMIGVPSNASRVPPWVHAQNVATRCGFRASEHHDVRFGSLADIFPGTFRTGLRWADIGESEWASAGRGD